jgi:DNA-binding Lrp family transcriptional regulator
MQDEFEVLAKISGDEHVTQRRIAQFTGLSVGSVNLLLKRLVKKGFVKIEKLNTRTVQYALTPGGFKEKSEAVYKYILNSYRIIQNVFENMDSIIKTANRQNRGFLIFFCIRDEIFGQLLKKLEGMENSFYCVDSIEEFYKLTGSLEDNYTVIAWQPAYEAVLRDKKIEYVSLTERI